MAPRKFITPRLPVDAWPEVDRQALRQARSPADLFDENGAAAHWSVPTVRAVEDAVGYWLGWLAEVEPAALTLAPSDRLSPARIRAFGKALGDALAPISVVHRLTHLADGIRVMYPQADRTGLDALCHSLKRQARPARPKEPRMVNAVRLVELGESLMREADGMTGTAAADWFRQGLTLSFLAYRPIRVANLVGISLNEHLHRKDGQVWIHIPGIQVKNRVPLDFFWPPELADALDRYLVRERPVLLTGQPTTDRLWIIEEGRPLTAGCCRTQIARITRERLDVRLTPHLFRDCVASTIAEHAPEHSGIIARILGHQTLQTAYAHYIHTGTARAARAHQAHIAALRSGEADRGT
jgi:integrase/recombinase XerD